MHGISCRFQVSLALSCFARMHRPIPWERAAHQPRSRRCLRLCAARVMACWSRRLSASVRSSISKRGGEQARRPCTSRPAWPTLSVRRRSQNGLCGAFKAALSMRNAARVWASLRGVQDDMLDVDISVDHLLYNVGDSTLLCRDHVSPSRSPAHARGAHMHAPGPIEACTAIPSARPTSVCRDHAGRQHRREPPLHVIPFPPSKLACPRHRAW